MRRKDVLIKLPPYQNRRQLITGRQTVRDIMREILKTHYEFAGHYDAIAGDFWRGSVRETCEALYRFCKKNIEYREEGEEAQTVKAPAAIVAHGYGDCKHYSLFIAGVLDALKRSGKKIDWHYCFASYDRYQKDPGHVFVIVVENGREIFVDPTPGADKIKPVYVIKKRPNSTNMLYKISGIDRDASSLLEDHAADEKIYMAIQILLKYGVMYSNGKIFPSKMYKLEKTLPRDEFAQVLDAYQILHAAAIGGLFGTIWRGIKRVTLAIPRNAYLSLVGLNAFGYATKLHAAIYNDDGTYSKGQPKVYDIWRNKLGGGWDALVNAVKRGYQKKAILGAAPAAVPAWVTAASAVIAALTPAIVAILKAKQQENGGAINYNIDPTTGLPYGSPPAETSGGSDPLGWISSNPIPVIGIAAAVYFLSKKN